MMSSPEVATALEPLEVVMAWKENQLPPLMMRALGKETLVAALKLRMAGLGLQPLPSCTMRAWLVPLPITQGLNGAKKLPHTLKVLAGVIPVTAASNLEEGARGAAEGLLASKLSSTLLASGFTEERPLRSYATNATMATVSRTSATTRAGLEGRKRISVGQGLANKKGREERTARSRKLK